MEDFELPVAKRQKLDVAADDSKSRLSQGSRMFAPFRTLGLVSSTAVPFTSIPLGRTTFQITTSVGRSLQTYDLLRGLNLVFLSRPQTPQAITATYAYKDKIFVAWAGSQPDIERGVWVLKRGRLVDHLEQPQLRQVILKILVFGSWIVGCGSHGIEIWKSDSYEHYTTIIPAENDGRNPAGVLSSQICSLPTFLNKIFVGRTNGNVEIYNVSTGKLVFTISPRLPSSGRVTALAPAPALALLAIAYTDGTVAIHNVEEDDLVMELHRPGVSSPVTSIAFRTDGLGAGKDGRSDGIMATASIESGDIILWDLNNGGRVTGVLRGAHEVSSSSGVAGITKIEFLQDQAVLISSGLDNALKSWIFDQTPFSPIPRILHSRSGHAAPITTLKFLPSASDGSEATGKWLLSAGQDRSLWAFSLRKDGQSTELSQGNVKSKAKKMGYLAGETSKVEEFKAAPITDIACSLNRDGGMGGVGGAVWKNTTSARAEEANATGWESIVTAHEGDRFARTWFWGRKKAGRWTLETGDRSPAASVAITSCGTFALVGSIRGSLDMFNLQSGIHRQRFPPRLKPAEAKKLKQLELDFDGNSEIQLGHTDTITGIVVDNLNQTVVSCSLDGLVLFWSFLTGHVIRNMHLPETAASAMRYNSTSGLISLACDDLCIRIVDIETQRIVRELWGCVGQIYDHCFSHDGRWIVACSMDSVVRVFDLATGHLIDAFRTATCTNVAFSSTGEFLATTHAGSIGINVWHNKTLFMHISTRQIDDETGVIDLTEANDFEANAQLALQDNLDGAEDLAENGNGVSVIDQLDKSLLTLSLVPQSRWQTLLNLETIRERNRPIQPPEKPKAAPFFLPSTLTNAKEATQSPSGVQNGSVSKAERSRISKIVAQQHNQSAFSALLGSFSADSSSNPAEVAAHLTSLAPSAADLEIRSLTLSEMPTFVHALIAQLYRRKDFELVNTWMSCFLKLHGDFVPEVPELRDAVDEWRKAMLVEERRLADLVGYTKGVLDFLRSAR